MSRRPPSAISYVAAVIAGFPAGMVAGAAVFSDGPGALSAERRVPIIVVYAVLGAVFGLIGRLVWATVSWRRWGVLVSLFGLVAIGLLGRDFGLGWQSLYVVVTLASASSGALGVARLTTRRRAHARDG